MTEVLTVYKKLTFYWHVTGAIEGRYKLHTDQRRSWRTCSIEFRLAHINDTTSKEHRNEITIRSW